MSLLGALNLGSSSLQAQQIGLQVTGNNIANAGTPGYTRETVNLTPSGPEQISPGQYVGTGVTVQGVERQVSEAINASLRDATSAQSGAQTLSDTLTSIETTFGSLNSNDLSSQLSTFFNNFSTLANNPQDSGQRSVVIQGGVTLSNYVQGLQGQLLQLHNNVQSQITTQATEANSLTQTIAKLNGQIAATGAGPGGANTLLDQRDSALNQLSQIMDIQTLQQGNGQMTVLVGGQPLVQGTTSRGITTVQTTDATGTLGVSKLTFADSGDAMNVTGGTLGGLIDARDNYVDNAMTTLDNFAHGLIDTVNSIHTQGQGLTGFSSVTGTTQVADPTAALNTAAAGLEYTPVNGTFNFYTTDMTTGQTTTQQIAVNLSGTGTQTTLQSLAASLTGGNITASVDSQGHLQIKSNSSNTQFSFSDDTSGTLASLGINTFFTGSNAGSIAVNNTLLQNANLLASGRGNTAGSNQNAQALALGYSAGNSLLGGQSLQNYYANYIGDLASKTKTALDDATAKSAIQSSLTAQQQSYSGVNMDEEAINLTTYQRAFEGTARYITVVDQMMQTVLGLIQ